jgi:hypothetical protein
MACLTHSPEFCPLPRCSLTCRIGKQTLEITGNLSSAATKHRSRSLKTTKVLAKSEVIPACCHSRLLSHRKVIARTLFRRHIRSRSFERFKGRRETVRDIYIHLVALLPLCSLLASTSSTFDDNGLSSDHDLARVEHDLAFLYGPFPAYRKLASCRQCIECWCEYLQMR